MDPYQIECNWQAYNSGYLQGMHIHHLASSFLKSAFQEVWNSIPDVMDETSSHRFRTGYDVFHSLISIWNVLEGNFSPVRADYYGKYYSNFEGEMEAIAEAFQKQKFRMICLNDTEATTPEKFASAKAGIIEILEQTFPQKSSFEK